MSNFDAVIVKKCFDLSITLNLLHRVNNFQTTVDYFIFLLSSCLQFMAIIAECDLYIYQRERNDFENFRSRKIEY